jgi:peptidoglycan/xylan/chitin deacetylase (PgdA/CDA1 family)
MKRIFMLTTISAISFLQSNAQMTSLHYEISDWQGNKDAAVSVTFDDNCAPQFTMAAPYMNSKNMRGTFFVIVDPYVGCSTLNWNWVRTTANGGHEIGSHTISHPHLTQLDSSHIEYELHASRDSINKYVTSQKCITLAYPFGDGGLNDSASAKVQEIAKKYYIGARDAGVGPSGCDDYNDPYGSGFINYYYQVGSKAIDSTFKIGQFKTLLNNTINKGSWFLPMYHSFDDPTDTLSVTTINFKAQMDAIDSMRNHFWIAPFGEIVRYRQEHDSQNLQLVSDNASKITLHFSDALPDSVFNVPLTIFLKIPADYNISSINQGSSDISFTRSNDTIQFNAIPDGDLIYLNKSGVLAGVHSSSKDFKLSGNFPNPASDLSNILYSLNVAANVRIELINMSGDVIKTLIQEEQVPGAYEIPINTSSLQPGIYMYRFIANNFIDMGRLAVIK